jgi:hypothetical protein
VGVVCVAGRRAERLQQHRALQGRQPDRGGQRTVFIEPPRQAPPDAGGRVIGVGHGPVPYTRDQWLDLVPTTGGFTRRPEAIQAELLDGLGAAVDAVGGTFALSYTTIAATAARLAS